MPHISHLGTKHIIKSINYMQLGYSSSYLLVRFFASVNPRMVLQIDSLRKGQSTYRTLVVLLAAVQLFVRPQTGIPRKRSTANIAVKRFLDLRRTSSAPVSTGGRLHLDVLVMDCCSADENHARSIAFVAFRDRRSVALFHRIVAGHQIVISRVLAVIDFAGLGGIAGLRRSWHDIRVVVLFLFAMNRFGANVHFANFEFHIAIGCDEYLGGCRAIVVAVGLLWLMVLNMLLLLLLKLLLLLLLLL